MRKSLLAAAACLVVVAGLFLALRRREEPPTAAPSPVSAKPQVGWFEDAADAAGVTFRLVNPTTPPHLIMETMPGGIGWIDYDSDGWPDLFCVQTGSNPADASTFYRNNRDGTFTDVTDKVGLRAGGYGFG